MSKKPWLPPETVREIVKGLSHIEENLRHWRKRIEAEVHAKKDGEVGKGKKNPSTSI